MPFQTANIRKQTSKHFKIKLLQQSVDVNMLFDLHWILICYSNENAAKTANTSTVE